MFICKAIKHFNKLYFSTCDRSVKTVQAYGNDLKQFQGFLKKNIKLSSIAPEMIENWAINLKNQNYAPASIQRKMSSLKVFFNYWVRKKEMPHSPMCHLKIDFGKSRILPKTLSQNEISSLLKQASSHLTYYTHNIKSIGFDFLALRNLAIVETMFSTGMRVGEIVSLNLVDFHQNERLIIVKGKGNRQRLAFLIEEHSFSIIIEYKNKLKELLPDNSAFFINIFRKRITTQGVANIISQLAQQAGIKKHITPHMLRHTAATFFLRNGADLRVVQEFLGHSSIITTQRYTHVSKEHLIDQLKNYHPAISIKR